MSVTVTTIPSGVRLSAGMTCPRCGHPMVLVSSSAAMVREWKAVMKCAVCHAEQLLLVRLLEVAPSPEEGRAPCGTTAGYMAHRRHNETACDDCRRANTDRRRAQRKNVA